MRTIKEASEHLKVPTCGGNIGVLQPKNKRTNIKNRNPRATPDPFDGPSSMMNPTRATPQQQKTNSALASNVSNIRKVNPFPQQQQRQQRQQQQQPYYDPRYTSTKAAQYGQPYATENTYNTYNTPYDYTPSSEEYYNQLYYNEYRPTYADYQRQSTTNSDNSTETYQQTNDYPNENRQIDVADVNQQQQPSTNNAEYPSTIGDQFYQRSTTGDDQRQRNLTEVFYYGDNNLTDDGYIEADSTQSNSNGFLQDSQINEDVAKEHPSSEDIQQYVC